MDTYEATRIVLSRIQALDPENASKIMGLLLIQDHGEKEMIRLAFGPEALVHSVVLKARKELGLASNSPSTPSTPSSPSPFQTNNHHSSLSRQNSSSSRLLCGVTGTNLPSPLSIPNQSSSSTSSAASCFSDLQNHDDMISPNSSSTSFSTVTSNGINSLASSSSMNSSASPYYGSGGIDLIDEFQFQDQLSFLDDGSPALAPKGPDFFYPHQDLASSPTGAGGDAMLFPSYCGANTANWGGSMNGLSHRRICSGSDIWLGSDDPAACGFGWKPCLYYARGYCKNGNSCRFLHSGLADSAAMVGTDGAHLLGSPNKLEMIEQCQELLRSKSAQQQRLTAASQLMASSTFPYSAVAATKCMNLLLHQQQTDTQRAATALMMGEDMNKFGRSRLERNDFPVNGGGPGIMNPGSRQIYLTFPSDSTFREEDVSTYFSNYGPVQDVRIPYQQKRMFGFVTFVYPETVKLILAKGNPHFVCDARVLVKPYKEKGKVPDKYRKHQQQMERGEFSACGSPTGLDSRDPYDLQFGAGMFCNTQDMLWRRKIEEQTDLQQAIELQGRRLMGLQLLDVRRQSHHRTLSTGAAIRSPTRSPDFFSPTLIPPVDYGSPEVPKVNGSTPAVADPAAVVGDQEPQQTLKLTDKESDLCTINGTNENGNGNGKGSLNQHEESKLTDSLEHNLPDSPFASPKAAGVYTTTFNPTFNLDGEAEEIAVAPALAGSSANHSLITSALIPATSTLDLASFKSCYFQVPRFSSGHGAIGM